MHATTFLILGCCYCSIRYSFTREGVSLGNIPELLEAFSCELHYGDYYGQTSGCSLMLKSTGLNISPGGFIPDQLVPAAEYGIDEHEAWEWSLSLADSIMGSTLIRLGNKMTRAGNLNMAYTALEPLTRRNFVKAAAFAKCGVFAGAGARIASLDLDDNSSMHLLLYAQQTDGLLNITILAELSAVESKLQVPVCHGETTGVDVQGNKGTLTQFATVSHAHDLWRTEDILTVRFVALSGAPLNGVLYQLLPSNVVNVRIKDCGQLVASQPSPDGENVTHVIETSDCGSVSLEATVLPIFTGRIHNVEIQPVVYISTSQVDTGSDGGMRLVVEGNFEVQRSRNSSIVAFRKNDWTFKFDSINLLACGLLPVVFATMILIIKRSN